MHAHSGKCWEMCPNVLFTRLTKKRWLHANGMIKNAAAAAILTHLSRGQKVKLMQMKCKQDENLRTTRSNLDQALCNGETIGSALQHKVSCVCTSICCEFTQTFHTFLLQPNGHDFKTHGVPEWLKISQKINMKILIK